MTYFEEIKSNIKKHIVFLESRIESSQKIIKHLETSKNLDNAVDKEDPEKLKMLIEYLSTESRGFGWTFPENEEEKLCEDSFWNMKNKMKKLVGRMTGDERLYYFGYLDEFDKISSNHKSDRDNILIKLFLFEDQ